MQYMNDPNLHVMRREERGMDVNDITGKSKTLHGPGSLPPTGPIERLQPVKPRIMEYDIINPTTGGDRMRMSQYGKNVLNSRGARRSTVPGSPPAGIKKLAKKGEENLEKIWPADEAQRNKVGLDVADVNLNKFGNQRMFKLKQEDNVRIQKFLAAKNESASQSSRPYKNQSNVFTHLVDDPTTRKPRNAAAAMNGRSSSMGPGQAEQDVLDRMMYDQPNYSAQDVAQQRQFDPVDMINGAQPHLGIPAQREQAQGKRTSRPDHMTVATGQTRLFGNDSASNAGRPPIAQKAGKRQIARPQQEGVGIFQ